MNLKRFALLGAFVALVAVVGAGAFSAKPASALTPSTKICTPTSVGTPAGSFPFTPSAAGAVTLNCTLTLNAGPGVFIAPGTTIQVSLFGAGATFTSVSLIGNCAGNAFLSSAAPTAFNAFPTPPTFPAGTTVVQAGALTTFALASQQYFVSVTNPLGCFDGTLSISENISIPAASAAAGVAGGTIAQQLTPVINPGALPAATIVATGPGGIPLVIVAPAPAAVSPFTASTKICSAPSTATPTSPAVLPAGSFTCTLTIRIGAFAGLTGGANVLPPGSTFLVSLSGSTAGSALGAVFLNNLAGVSPVVVLQGTGGSSCNAAVSNVTASSFLVTVLTSPLIPGQGCAVGDVIVIQEQLATSPAGSAGGAVVCQTLSGITASNLGAFFAPGTVTSINAAFALGQVICSTFTTPSAVAPPITPNTFVPRVTCATLASATLPGFVLGNAIFGFGAGAVLPGQLGINSLIAISVLPVPVNCQITFFTSNAATATQIAIPGGVIEVSSINGALIDASGRLSTNLRIGCGDNFGGNFVVGTPVVTNTINNCIGVTFSVAGTGVGLSEVRFRYEPRDPALLTTLSFDGAFAVAFVAPQAVLDLTLAPNPVSAGGTATAGTATSDGTATLTLNPTFGANIFRDPVTNLPFLDPTTGAPLLLNSGSILNGSVIFTIDNTAIARFVGAGLSTLGTSTTTTATSVTNTTTAVAATSDTVIVRCGTLSQVISGGASQAGLLPFFGGCRTASVGYRGIVAGSANITATFIPDLPGAVNSTSIQGLGLGISAFTGFGNLNFSGFTPSSITRQLQVLDAPVSGTINLVRGCNNVSPTVTESVSAFIARAQGTTVISVFEYQAATNTFLGAPGPGAPAGAPGDLAGVTRLRPVFICVTGPGTLNQPAA